MSKALSELFADESGVWERNDSAPAPQGIEWDQIYRVGGCRIDAIDRVLVYVVLDYVYGEYFEFNNAYTRFEQVVQTITATLPRIDAAWFQAIENLPLGESVTMWQRT